MNESNKSASFIEADPEAEKALARRSFFEQSYMPAMERMAHLLQRDANNAEAAWYVALHCLVSNQLDISRALLTKLITAAPDNLLFRFMLGHVVPLVEGTGAQVFHERLRNDNYAATSQTMLQAIVDEGEWRGINPAALPVLVSVNGDPMWFWADQLRFIWHVIAKPFSTYVPECRAETEHYEWSKAHIRPGDTVLDIGSNIGLFTNMMSLQVGPEGRVHCFEPNPVVLEDLRRICRLNEWKNISIHEVAAAEYGGTATFQRITAPNVYREGSRLTDSALSDADASTSELITVMTARLDDYLASLRIQPNFIKMDIEGAEIGALKGLVRTIEAHRPHMVIEFHPDHTGVFDHQWMQEFLRGHRYSFSIDTKNYYCTAL